MHSAYGSSTLFFSVITGYTPSPDNTAQIAFLSDPWMHITHHHSHPPFPCWIAEFIHTNVNTSLQFTWWCILQHQSNPLQPNPQ